MLPLNTIKRRFRSGAYVGIPAELLNEIKTCLEAERKEWELYPHSKPGILARLYQTKVRAGWAYPGEKLYYQVCEELDKMFLP